jgi:hypothetical protein
MLEMFTQHPSKVGESYLHHAKFAICCGVKLIMLGVMAIVHGLLPFLFETTASDGIRNLNKCLEQRKDF